MTWTNVVEAIGTILTPIVVAALAYVFGKNQSLSAELVKRRLDGYQLLIPDLNKLMCYMTFIGTWRDMSPPDVIRLKRRLDENFYCAAPLFSEEIWSAYEALMETSFLTFGSWGRDAKIRTNAYRRRQAWQTGSWNREWDHYFELDDTATISEQRLRSYRDSYDKLVAALVRDIDIKRARSRYTTNQVVLNAHAPRAEMIPGAGTE